MAKEKFSPNLALLAGYANEVRGISQSDIAISHGVSQSTISRNIQKARSMAEIYALTVENHALKAENHALKKQLEQQKLSAPSEKFLSISPQT